MTDSLKSKAEKLEKFKYPLVVLVIGIMLMLIPSSSFQPKDTADKDEQVARILSQTEGTGETQVLISESGVVVACKGAEKAKVRLDIIRAVSSYTGFTSDKITILKLAD